MVPVGYSIRPLTLADAPAMAAAYTRNRAHLRRWDPARPDSFFTEVAQREQIAAQLETVAAGLAGRWLPIAPDGTIVGRISLQNIVRGAMHGGTVGYWVDVDHLRRGLARTMLDFVAEQAVAMGLHRLEGDTMVENAASRAVLRAAGFTEIGIAPRLLFIDGAWRDHVLHQRILHDGPPSTG